MSAPVNNNLNQTAPSAPLPSFMRDWLVQKLSALNKRSLRELTPQELLDLQEAAKKESNSIYFKSSFSAIAISLVAFLTFASATVIGGGLLFTLTLFASDSVLIPVIGSAAILGIYGLKKIIEYAPSFYKTYFVDPFENAKKFTAINQATVL